MKRLIGIVLLLCLLCGCSRHEENMDRAMALRSKLQQCEVAFSAELTADYGNKQHTFTLDCQADVKGNLKFTVAAPEKIAGITGSISQNSGKLTFDDKILAFDILADGLVSPVSGPWVLMETLRGGYLTSCSQDGEYLRVAIDDSYAENALHLEVWLDSEDTPQGCEIYWQGRRLLSMNIKNFRYL
ncbi:MAG: hypothetical protein E7447_04855 [Ruminococcaceae bacterium]|nr:hypothetical protein [Oscillospiraceae bacterium]